jgi:hypothetical protein
MELERDRDALLASHKALALEELDGLSPQEHHDFYRTLRMIVYRRPEGGVEITGVFLPFDAPGRDGPPNDPSGGNGSNSATQGFSTNINTQACARGATVRRASADSPRQADPADRIPSRPPA